MSIKRTKQRTYGRRDDGVAFTFNKPEEAAPEKTWEEQMAGQPEEAFVPYSMKSVLSKGALIAHPKFGKGIVVAVEDSRVDVLFSEGKKKLGHRLT